MYNYKKGDKIIVTEEFTQDDVVFYPGAKGTFITLESEMERYGIEWDCNQDDSLINLENQDEDFHDLDGIGQEGVGWWIDSEHASHFKLVIKSFKTLLGD